MKIGARSIIMNKSENGFSLMEVLLSIYIILTALVGIMALISSINASASNSSAKLVAASLAQEGIEIVKNIRDLNFGANSWDDWYNSFGPIGVGADYEVQYDDTSLSRAWSDTPLKYEVVNGLWRYGYSAGTATPFVYKRKVTLTPMTLDSDSKLVEVKVSVQVTWTEHGRPGSLIAEDRLWNWR